MQPTLGVAMISSVFYPSIGGAQRVAADTARLLRARGVAAFVVTRHFQGLARYEDVQGVPTYRVGRGEAGKIVAALSFVWGALWLLWRLRGRYDVLHCHQMISPMTIGLVARALTGRPLVVMPHRSGPIGDIGVLTTRRPLTGRPRLLAARRWVDAFVCISPAIRAELLAIGVPAARLWDIANGVDTTRFQPVSFARREELRHELGLPGGRVAVYAGRLVPEKGLNVLITAWPTVCERVPDARIVLVGAGEQRSELERQAALLGLGDAVLFVNGSDDVAPFLQAADAFVLPSFAEGLPVALLEALACGVPCVGTNIDGTAQVIENGVTGRLVPAGDPAALATAVVEAFTNPGAAAWGERGRTMIMRQYTLETVIGQYLAMYRAVAPAFATLPPAAARRDL
jgi:glycosyltransferase involved in cell wall biosynthesis